MAADPVDGPPVVCLRWRPAALAGRGDEPDIAAFLDERNQALMEAVNGTGEVLLSHARLAGRFVIRVAFGNLRTEDRQLHRVGELLQAEPGRHEPGPAAGR